MVGSAYVIGDAAYVRGAIRVAWIVDAGDSAILVKYSPDGAADTTPRSNVIAICGTPRTFLLVSIQFMRLCSWYTYEFQHDDALDRLACTMV